MFVDVLTTVVFLCLALAIPMLIRNEITERQAYCGKNNRSCLELGKSCTYFDLL